jgi:hypothetical protein
MAPVTLMAQAVHHLSIVKIIDVLTFLVTPCPVNIFHNIHGVDPKAPQLRAVMGMIKRIITGRIFKTKIQVVRNYLCFCAAISHR